VARCVETVARVRVGREVYHDVRETQVGRVEPKRLPARLFHVGVAVEKVLKVKGGREERIVGEVLDENAVGVVNALKRLSLMLDARPCIPELAELLHLFGQEVGRRAEYAHLAVVPVPRVVRAVDVNGAGGADTIPHKGWPFDGCRLLPELDEFGDRIGVKEAHVGSLNLPGLVLARPSQFGEVDGKEWSVDEAVNQMVDELAQDQRRGIGLAKEVVQTRKHPFRP